MKYIFLFALSITIIAAIITFVLGPIIQGNVYFSSGIFPNGTAIPKDLLSCKKDSDCFAGECCHARFCVNSIGKPDCEGVFCTQECRNGTLDCDYGSCVCVNGRCTAKFVQGASKNQ